MSSHTKLISCALKEMCKCKNDTEKDDCENAIIFYRANQNLDLMFTKYIPQIIEFKNIREDEYENCMTRDEWDEQLKKESGPQNQDGSFPINPNCLIDVHGKLFAEDKIIGVYKHEDDKYQTCFYIWKKNNNPREIFAYSLLMEFEQEEIIRDNEIILLKPIKK